MRLHLCLELRLQLTLSVVLEMEVPHSCHATNSNMMAPMLRIQVNVCEPNGPAAGRIASRAQFGFSG